MRPGTPIKSLAVVVFVLSALVIATPSPASAADWPLLQVGSQGADVQAVQHLLTAHGFGTDADGIFGPNTRSSVIAFQNSRGLDADGIVGPNTWANVIVTVQNGSTGSAVSAAQVELNKYGYGLSVDGIFGDGTHAATVAFQQSHGLTADGIIGANTWFALASGGGGGTPGPYSLPLPADAVDRSEYDDPHHDYPALDLPAVTGTPSYAVTNGTATPISSSSCGLGVVLDGADGGQYTYCHFDSHAFGSPQQVSPGQHIGNTGSTGNSTGPHLHLQIRAGGALRCPQSMMLAIWDGASVPSPDSLPTSGCSY